MKNLILAMGLCTLSVTYGYGLMTYEEEEMLKADKETYEGALHVLTGFKEGVSELVGCSEAELVACAQDKKKYEQSPLVSYKNELDGMIGTLSANINNLTFHVEVIKRRADAEVYQKTIAEYTSLVEELKELVPQVRDIKNTLINSYEYKKEWRTYLDDEFRYSNEKLEEWRAAQKKEDASA